jgi:hypothetical protein
MARYDHLPIWAAALKTAVAIERAAARFPRAHRYVLGADMRRASQRVCGLVVRANAARGERARALEHLVLAVEQLKLLVQLGKEVRAFASFAEFEDIARSVVELGKQSGGWRRRQGTRQEPEAAPGSGCGARNDHCAPAPPSAGRMQSDGIGTTSSYPGAGR